MMSFKQYISEGYKDRIITGLKKVTPVAAGASIGVATTSYLSNKYGIDPTVPIAHIAGVMGGAELANRILSRRKKSDKKLPVKTNAPIPSKNSHKPDPKPMTKAIAKRTIDSLRNR